MRIESSLQKRLHCLLLDPLCFSPFYDFNLLCHLVGRGWHIEWITSKFPFEALPACRDVLIKPFFFSQFPVAWLLARNAIAYRQLLRGTVKMIFYPIEMLRFSNYLTSFPPGIVHIQWANLPWLDRILWCNWKSRGWKLVYTAHDPLPLKGTTPQFFSVQKDLLHSLDAVVVHSRKGREQIMRQGFESERIYVCKMGPTLLTDMKPVARDAANRQLGLPDNQLNILFFGFIKPYKGLDNLLRSLSLLCKVSPGVCLIVAGKLMEPFSRYQKIIDTLRPTPRIIWNPDFIPSDSIPLYFSVADVVVAPYHQGSSSSVIDLAHYFNKPVVATNVGGLPEQIDTDYGDTLIPPGSPGLLAQAIMDVFKRQRERKNTFEARLHPFDFFKSQWDAIAAFHEKIYNEISQFS